VSQHHFSSSYNITNKSITSMLKGNTVRYVLLLMFNFVVASVVSEDVGTDCRLVIAETKCHGEVPENCRAECTLWLQDRVKFRRYDLPDDKSFHDVTGITATGSTIEFDRFEDYVTLVMPLAKTCSNAKESDVAASFLFDSIEHLKSVFPYSLEIVVFPFEHPSVNYSDKHCEEFEKETKKRGRTIHVMETSIITGPDAHPMFKLINEAMAGDDLNLNSTAFFILNLDLKAFEMHYGKSLVDMRDTVREWVKKHDKEL
jgi:glutathione peroxidase-family protein